MDSLGTFDAATRSGDVLAGKYRVERVLGAGGMSVVVSAYRVQLDEKLPQKFRPPGALQSGDTIMRFDGEAPAPRPPPPPACGLHHADID
jgi:hypothetical protein